MPSKKQSTDVIATLEEQFAKAPALPKGVVDTLVSIAPWLAIIFGVLGVFGSLAAIGIMGAVSPMLALGGELSTGVVGMVVGVLSLIGSVMMVLAFKKLQDHKIEGWTLIFWSEVLSVVSAVISMAWGGVIFSLISFYLLFQMKPRYK